MKRIGFMMVAGIFFVNISTAQNAFNKATASEKKIKVQFDFPPEGRNSKNGKGYSANVELINPKPKKIALVSFYLYDPAKGKATGGVYTGIAKTAVWRTSDELGQDHIDAFYAEGIDALKASFKEYNMDLLTPDEFLDTEEKKDFYYGFNQESAKKEKTTVTKSKNAGTGLSTIASSTMTTLKICPSGKGYREFFVANEAADESTQTVLKTGGIFSANRQMTSSLGYELCKGLGVDAVVVCYIVTRKLKKNKEDYGVNAVNLFMFGPNPVSEGADDKNRGQFYCGTRVYYKGAKAVFHDSKSNKTSTKGFANIMAAMGRKNCKWVIEKAKK
ncbi:MAG: hypothetical protein R3277_00315 [Brumimicrobium sp.]|nr:hypothetical protein [Brumimicrobium sp.]